MYVELFDEGTRVWRPVEALKIGTGLFRLSDQCSEQMEGEVWAFGPGTTVECEERIVADGSLAWFAVNAGHD